MSKNTKILIVCIAYAVLSIANLLTSFRVSNLEKQVDKLQSTQTKLEKRVDNLQQAMQTKDKELEAGLRNAQNGLMLKIDYLEKQIEEVEDD